MTSEFIKLLQIERDKHTVLYRFECSEGLEPFLWDCREFVISCNEEVVGEEARLASIFAYAFAPIGWINKAEIILPCPLPNNAVKSLRDVGRIACNHYGWTYFDPFATVQCIEETPRFRHHRGLFYSGGVDSNSALIERLESIDWLIHVSNFENLDAHLSPAQREAGPSQTKARADAFGLGFLHLRTNFAEIIKHNKLDFKFPKDCSFWLGLQHVHHLATALLPIRPAISQVLMAGGFDELHRAVGSCAASTEFVNAYAYEPSLSLIDEFEKRQSKVERLLDKAPELLRELRVCYSSGDGTCSKCRKCKATAMMIVSAGGKLANTSFPQETIDAIIETAEELRCMEAKGNQFYFQSLTGRAIEGNTSTERWDSLLQLLRQQRHATYPTDLGCV